MLGFNSFECLNHLNVTFGMSFSDPPFYLEPPIY